MKYKKRKKPREAYHCDRWVAIVVAVVVVVVVVVMVVEVEVEATLRLC